MSGIYCSSRPIDPTAMIPISAPFTMRMIRALSMASASWPDRAESRKKGRMNKPVASALKLDSMRSEEHTSELQSLMRISYAVFCLKKKKKHDTRQKKQQYIENNRY